MKKIITILLGILLIFGFTFGESIDLKNNFDLTIGSYENKLDSIVDNIISLNNNYKTQIDEDQFKSMSSIHLSKIYNKYLDLSNYIYNQYSQISHDIDMLDKKYSFGNFSDDVLSQEYKQLHEKLYSINNLSSAIIEDYFDSLNSYISAYELALKSSLPAKIDYESLLLDLNNQLNSEKFKDIYYKKESLLGVIKPTIIDYKNQYGDQKMYSMLDEVNSNIETTSDKSILFYFMLMKEIILQQILEIENKLPDTELYLDNSDVDEQSVNDLVEDNNEQSDKSNQSNQTNSQINLEIVTDNTVNTEPEYGVIFDSIRGYRVYLPKNVAYQGEIYEGDFINISEIQTLFKIKGVYYKEKNRLSTSPDFEIIEAKTDYIDEELSSYFNNKNIKFLLSDVEGKKFFAVPYSKLGMEMVNNIKIEKL